MTDCDAVWSLLKTHYRMPLLFGVLLSWSCYHLGLALIFAGFLAPIDFWLGSLIPLIAWVGGLALLGPFSLRWAYGLAGLFWVGLTGVFAALLGVGLFGVLLWCGLLGLGCGLGYLMLPTFCIGQRVPLPWHRSAYPDLLAWHEKQTLVTPNQPETVEKTAGSEMPDRPEPVDWVRLGLQSEDVTAAQLEAQFQRLVNAMTAQKRQRKLRGPEFQKQRRLLEISYQRIRALLEQPPAPVQPPASETEISAPPGSVQHRLQVAILQRNGVQGKIRDLRQQQRQGRRARFLSELSIDLRASQAPAAAAYGDLDFEIDTSRPVVWILILVSFFAHFIGSLAYFALPAFQNWVDRLPMLELWSTIVVTTFMFSFVFFMGLVWDGMLFLLGLESNDGVVSRAHRGKQEGLEQKHLHNQAQGERDLRRLQKQNQALRQQIRALKRQARPQFGATDWTYWHSLVVLLIVFIGLGFWRTGGG